MKLGKISKYESKINILEAQVAELEVLVQLKILMKASKCVNNQYKKLAKYLDCIIKLEEKRMKLLLL